MTESHPILPIWANMLKIGDRFFSVGSRGCGHEQKVTGVNQYGTFAKCVACDYKYELDPAALVAFNKPKRRTSK